MAEAESYSERLKLLSERAAASRQALAQAGHSLQASAHIGRRVQTSIRGNLTAWLGSAALVGWVLSKLPARKKKVYVHSAGGTAEAAKGGLFVAGLGLVFQLVRPLLQKMLVEQVGAYAEKRFAHRVRQPTGQA